MKPLATFLSIATVLAAPLLAADTTLSSRYLSVTTTQEQEHLISSICDPIGGSEQLRAQAKALAPMLGGKGEGERGGTRILWEEEGEVQAVEWQVTEQSETQLHLASENANATAVLQLAEGESRFLLELQWDETSPLQNAPLLWEWALEVGGDFFAVPTEGVADHQILPIATEGGQRKLKVIPVGRHEEGSEMLAEPWWAVADRNRGVVLVCRFSLPHLPKYESVKLLRTSGVQGSTDAFFQTLHLPHSRSQQQSVLRATVMLFTHIPLFNGLGEGSIWQLSHKHGKLEVQAATCRQVSGGEVVVRHGQKELARWTFEDWTPEQPLHFSSPIGKEQAAVEQSWTLELRPQKGEAEVISIDAEERL